jgi:hypothetical protein
MEITARPVDDLDLTDIYAGDPTCSGNVSYISRQGRQGNEASQGINMAYCCLTRI